jgi:ATPase subunit of ABC transporter with duplicated ATPase domains
VAIEVQSVSYSYPDGTTPIEDVSFRVPTGSVTALVGPNGVGKTTMLELIAGHKRLADGHVRSDTEIAYMRQNPGFDDLESATVLDALALSLPVELRPIHARLQDLYVSAGESDGIDLAHELEIWQSLGGYDAEGRWDQVTRAVLRQGLADAGDRRLTELSGGERKAIILRAYLLSNVQTLILDEPDNYLDLFSKAWLANELRNSGKTILLVSHDRKLLTQAVDRMVSLEHNHVWTHGGTYATFPQERRKRIEKLAKDLDAWKAEERRLYRHFKLLKQRAGASEALANRADAAESRWERYVAAGPPQLPPPEREITTKFRGSRTGREAIRLTDFEVEGLVAPFSTIIYNEEKVALLGENGVGKTTFLRKIVDGKGEADDTIRFGPTARIGYFSQTNEIDDPSLATFDVVRHHFPNDQATLSAMGRYGLADHGKHKLSQLSGGQKARVQLLILETEDPNVLLLDEPTDNLDLESILIIEEALLELEATQVAITHDATFTRVFDRFIIFDRHGVVAETLDREYALWIASHRAFSLLDDPKMQILST